MARLTVDFEADAAYLQVSDKPVAETREAAPGIQVDLDQYGCAVGIEVLELSLEIPADEIIRKFHLRHDDMETLKRIRPDVTSFVTRWTTATVRPERPDAIQTVAA